MHATERRGFEQVLEDMPAARRDAARVLERIQKVYQVAPQARVLDVGAAHGAFVAAWSELGYRSAGVEPSAWARDNSRRLSAHLGITVEVLPGTAESIPFGDSTFDVVHAGSVVEHVLSAQRAFAEAFRVLKPGGVFYFRTASSMCPLQDEIRGFPFFGWYPDQVKLRIMNWAKTARPDLVGHTETPAIHWFTPWKARRMLRATGFGSVFDRWDLRCESEGGTAYRAALKVIRTGSLTKIAADILIPGCTYAAIKAAGGNPPPIFLN